MGQIFHACAYDIETKTRCVYDADKFHANCYAHSGAVFSIHYLLRNKPYHIMWGGNYVAIENNIAGQNIADISRTEVLLGISTYMDYEDFFRDDENIPDEKIGDKAKFIGENNKLWKSIDVWDEAQRYFDWEHSHSVKYCGYLVNHTKNLAVNLADYQEQSKFLGEDGQVMAIDLIPVLTETGGGTQMALFNGISIDSTEQLAGEWCGDLLQIVDDLPLNYKVINCCFAEVWNRTVYCYYTFGLDEQDFVIKDSSGKRIEVTDLSIFGKRGPPCYIKAESSKGKIIFKSYTEKEKLKKRNNKHG